METQPQLKLDSNKIEARNLELIKPTVSYESRGQFHKIVRIIFILRISQVPPKIPSYYLVVEFNSAGNGLGQGEAGGLGDNARELVPSFLGHVLGDQAVGRLDGWEISHFTENKMIIDDIQMGRKMCMADHMASKNVNY